MRLRLKLLRIILRNCKPLFFIPIIIAYCLLPGVSAFKYFYVDPSEARSTFIYMSQVFIPLCGLLWPMGYLHVWVGRFPLLLSTESLITSASTLRRTSKTCSAFGRHRLIAWAQPS